MNAIGFIGAGKVGSALGRYFKENGLEISGYFSRSISSAQRAAEWTGSVCYPAAESLLKESGIVFLTTPDDQIQSVCDSLAQRNAFMPGQVVVHASGALSSAILASAKQCGGLVYSLHPLQAFADISKALTDLPHTVFSLEGDPERLQVLEDLLKQTGNPYFKIQAQHKVLYHAAACILSNYLVALADQGLALLHAIGIDPDQGFNAMMPLITGTINNIKLLGTDAALTGPIVRGDVETIRNHLDHIRDHLPGKLTFYKLMGRHTLDIAARRKLKDSEKIAVLKELFNLDG